jgi:hypothetical protein
MSGACMSETMRPIVRSHDNITDIYTYMRLCGRPHNRMYSENKSMAALVHRNHWLLHMQPHFSVRSANWRHMLGSLKIS